MLTVSIHRGDEGFFPGTGKPAEIGKGKGMGYNVNVSGPATIPQS